MDDLATSAWATAAVASMAGGVPRVYQGVVMHTHPFFCRRALQPHLPPPARGGHDGRCGAGGRSGREPLAQPAAGAASCGLREFTGMRMLFVHDLSVKAPRAQLPPRLVWLAFQWSSPRFPPPPRGLQGCAWVGHFWFEHNRPATFRYPLWSLAADFRLWWEVLSGQRSF